MSRPYKPVHAPRGPEISCRSWAAEAALRMLMNGLDPEVGRDPRHLVVHGGAGRAVRSWAAYDAIVQALQEMAPDETLLVQSGVPVGRFRTDLLAPRVLISHSMVVPAWASAEEFRSLESGGLTLEGRQAAGAWMFTGLRTFLATAFETMSEVADTHFDGSLSGRLVVTGGLGASGSAQAPAVKMAKGTALIAEVDEARIDALQMLGIIDHRMDELDQAIDMAIGLKSTNTAQSVAWLGNAVDLLLRLRERGIVPDVVTDMTGGLDCEGTYVPHGMDGTAAAQRAASQSGQFEAQAAESVARHVQLLIELRNAGSVAFEFGNALRAQAELAGVTDAFDLPGFYATYVRPRVIEGRSPLTLVALSGERSDMDTIDAKLRELAAEDSRVLRYLAALAEVPVAEQGLPSQTYWLRFADQAELGRLVNRLVRDQDVKAPIAVLRGPLDPGTVTSPFRETEQMPDGSDAVADWPILASLLAAAAGATWVSVGHGGGAGIGFSVHSAAAVVASGSPEADVRLRRVLGADPSFGLLRLAAAGDPDARAAVDAANLYGA